MINKSLISFSLELFLMIQSITKEARWYMLAFLNVAWMVSKCSSVNREMDFFHFRVVLEVCWHTLNGRAKESMADVIDCCAAPEVPDRGKLDVSNMMDSSLYSLLLFSFGPIKARLHGQTGQYEISPCTYIFPFSALYLSRKGYQMKLLHIACSRVEEQRVLREETVLRWHGRVGLRDACLLCRKVKQRASLLEKSHV